MATVVRTPETPSTSEARKALGPARVLLRNISWTLYKQLRDDETNWGVRMAFDSGDLELMSPSQRLEEIGYRFELFMVALAQALGFKFAGMAHTTWENEVAEKAKEPDACYYIANFERIRGKTVNLEVDPPPDLAVEVEVSRSAIKSLRIYGAIGVPEVWRFDGEDLTIHLRQADGTYIESDQSPALPFVRPEEVVFWLKRSFELGDNMAWMTEVQDWARLELAPRLNRP
jgi:Uma2 family endonuclease